MWANVVGRLDLIRGEIVLLPHISSSKYASDEGGDGGKTLRGRSAKCTLRALHRVVHWLIAVGQEQIGMGIRSVMRGRTEMH